VKAEPDGRDFQTGVPRCRQKIVTCREYDVMTGVASGDRQRKE